MGRLKQYYFDQLTQLDDTWWREDMADMAYQEQKQAEDEFCQHWVQLDLWQGEHGIGE